MLRRYLTQNVLDAIGLNKPVSPYFLRDLSRLLPKHLLTIER